MYDTSLDDAPDGQRSGVRFPPATFRFGRTGSLGLRSRQTMSTEKKGSVESQGGRDSSQESLSIEPQAIEPE